MLSSLSACDSLNKDRKPYTPFKLDENEARGLSASNPSDSEKEEKPASSSFEAAQAIVAPPNSRELQIGAFKRIAPNGLLFSIALAWSGTDPDQSFAVMVPSKASQSRPGIYRFRQSKVEEYYPLPASLPFENDCTLAGELSQIGPGSLLADLSINCPNNTTKGIPTRSVSILTPLQSRKELLRFMLVEEENARLNVEATVTNTSEDQRDDLRLSFQYTDTSGERSPEISWDWYDRAAGASAAPNQLSNAFRDMAKLFPIKAKGKNTSKEVLSHLSAQRQLWRAFCGESRASLIFDSRSKPIACGNLESTLIDWSMSEVRSHLTQADLPKAWGAWAARAWFASTSRSKVTKSKLVIEVEKELLAATEIISPEITKYPFKTRSVASDLHFSSLSFDEQEHLLLTQEEGIFRVDNGELVDISEEIDPWRAIVSNPNGEQLGRVEIDCDQAYLSVSVREKTGQISRRLPLSILSPQPAACDPSVPLSLDARAVRFGNDQATLLINGVVYSTASKEFGEAPLAAFPGNPYSANRKYHVAKLEDGLLVLGEDKPQLWQVGDTSKFDDCVISNSGRHVACVSHNTPIVFSKK